MTQCGVRRACFRRTGFDTLQAPLNAGATEGKPRLEQIVL
jgi:hypothetical protein